MGMEADLLALIAFAVFAGFSYITGYRTLFVVCLFFELVAVLLLALGLIFRIGIV